MTKIVRDKKPLCTTKQGCFTQIQGIGNDPMYLRYDSFLDILARNVEGKYVDFFAEPVYSDIEDTITWYGKTWLQEPMVFSELSGTDAEHYKLLKDKYISYYQSAIQKASVSDGKIIASALKFIMDDFLYCYDDSLVLVAWGMQVDAHVYVPKGTITYSAARPKVVVEFDAGDFGQIDGRQKYLVSVVQDGVITEQMVPQVGANEGYRFTGWDSNPVGVKVHEGKKFEAKYEKVYIPEPPVVNEPEPEPDPESTMFRCEFDAGDNGSIDGDGELYRESGYRIKQSDIPRVTPKKGYMFKGWDESPIDYCLTSNKTFVAQYEEKSSWWKRLFLWWSGLSIWKWLRWVLLTLLGLLLCWLFFRSCGGCSGPIGGNGVPHNILDDNGNIPVSKSPVVAPIADAPIIENPGAPSVVGDRLNIYFEDDDANLNQFAHEFKEAYPSEAYEIVGFDDEVKMVQIRIPSSERDQVRSEIVEKIPSQKFIVVDEAIFELSNNNGFSNSGSNPGWHLDAIKAKDAWQEAGTKGNPDIVVAVVDDGMDVRHKMLKGKIVSPYNVFRKDGKLSTGIGHGTHVAGLAIGNDNKLAEGLSGVAPNCKVMPIQVFDNNKATFSSVTSGIMYAIHHDANVINVSAGECFTGLNALPESAQLDLANNYFKNEEFVWNKIFAVAKKKNITIVFAAGNDHILACVPPEHRNCEVVTVAAVDHGLKATQFTNYGPGANISAPGVDIYSSVPGNKYQFADGTSMSAPIVSGAIALLKSLNPNLESEDLIRVLQSTGKPTDADNIRPLIQLDKAVEAVKASDIPNADVYNCRWFPDESAIPDNSAAKGSYISIPDGSTLVTNPDGSVAIVDDKTGDSEVVIPAPSNGSSNSNNNLDETSPHDNTSTNADGKKNGNGSNNHLDGDNNSPTPAPSKDGFEAIRQKIAQLKKQISELEKQLPENKKRK